MLQIKLQNGTNLKFHNFKEKKDVPIQLIEITEKFINELRYLISNTNGSIGFYQQKDLRIEAAKRAMDTDYTPELLSTFLRELKRRNYGLNVFTLTEAKRLARSITKLSDKPLLSHIYLTLASKIRNKAYCDLYATLLVDNANNSEKNLTKLILRCIGYKNAHTTSKVLTYQWYTAWSRNYKDERGIQP